MDKSMFKVLIYRSADGREPFAEWFESIRDPSNQDRIDVRLRRMELGNLGDHRAVGEGVCELRLHFGPGYRVYFAREGDTVILLLLGGDKSSQTKDIAKAQEYWRRHKELKS
jgi:putative addiction module killer protein